jgi:hypothetical protein
MHLASPQGRESIAPVSFTTVKKCNALTRPAQVRRAFIFPPVCWFGTNTELADRKPWEAPLLRARDLVEATNPMKDELRHASN